MKTLGYLISCQGRQLFMRDAADCSWAYLDDEYTVTELVAKAGEELIDAPSTDETQERLQLLEQIYELEEQQIAAMKGTLESAVELIESINEFASKKTENVMELKGLMLLIAESCREWLKPKP
jgi:hypothetical protein